jgi:serine/threonine protein phosphatase PrpC
MSDSTAAPPSLDALAFATLSDAGRVRTENQDAADVVQNTSGERLLIVADGMGGHLGGEKASRMCLDWVERCFREPHGSPEERLRRGLVLANEEIYSHALANPELRGMGTTAVALLLSPGGGALVAWVGDSRAYRLRDGTLEALTRDHSLMAEWISLGVLTVEAAETHPRRHELTRALGQAPDVKVDVAPLELRAGDRFLLCSDGLHGYVPERAVRAVLAEGTPEECARTLVERANANGGSDNVSVVVALLPAAAEVPIAPPAAAPLELAPPDLAAGLEAAAIAAPEPGALTLAELSFGDELAPPEPEPPASSAADPGSLTFGELSFGDVLAEPESEAAAIASEPPPEPESELAPTPTPEPAPERPPAFVPLLDPPKSSEIRIPRMTPVRSRRLFDAHSALAGVAATLVAGALGFALWRYTADGRAPEPAPPRAEVARAPTPLPPAPVARPAPAPAPPPPAPRPELTEVAVPDVAKWAPPPLLPPPAPVIAPAAPAPTPAAPDPGAIASSAGFELPAPVARFVDDWLRAVSTRDLARLDALGMRALPDELAGSFSTRDTYRLVAASLDEERSHAGRYFVRLVVSYAFRDATGRFRTQDEQRWILRDVGGTLRYEGRWQQ